MARTLTLLLLAVVHLTVRTMGEECECTPVCQSTNGTNGTRGDNEECSRRVARPDCPCCLLCAVGLGEMCDLERLCDLGHVCSDHRCVDGKANQTQHQPNDVSKETSAESDRRSSSTQPSLVEVPSDSRNNDLEGNLPSINENSSFNTSIHEAKPPPTIVVIHNSVPGGGGGANQTKCKYNGTSYAVGEDFLEGCEQRCWCQDGGLLICAELHCTLPLFKKGTFAKDPLCHEQMVDPEGCCVAVACAQESSHGVKGINPCDKVACGPHAECRHEVSPSSLQGGVQETLCVCEEGFMGDPYDVTKGCRGATVTNTSKTECTFNNETYRSGEEFFDGCEYRCLCNSQAEIECKARCPPTPSEVKPGCTVDRDPRDSCCEVVECEDESGESSEAAMGHHPQVPSDGCLYKNRTYTLNETFVDGCEQKCQCVGIGYVTCHARCPPSSVGSTSDKCTTLPDPIDPCCMVTVCDQDMEGEVMRTNITSEESEEDEESREEVATEVPISQERHANVSDVMEVEELKEEAMSITGFGTDTRQPGSGHGSGSAAGANSLRNLLLTPLNATTVQISFSLPPVLVGLHGVVEVMYSDDPSSSDEWERQVFAQQDELLHSPQLEFALSDLHPDTEYHLRVTILMRDIQNGPSSPIVSVHTPPEVPQTTTTKLPPQLVVNTELRVSETSPTHAQLTWRTLSPMELQLTDGVQLKYRRADEHKFSTSPLLHRTVTSYLLEDLVPETEYEVDLLFLPVAGSSTVLLSVSPVHLATAVQNDPYNFEVAIEESLVSENSVTITWNGIPSPEDKFVSIYQVTYQSDREKEQTNSFKQAKKDTSSSIIIKNLKPVTRYRLWMEVYLTNGKRKRSNTIDIVTKPGVLSSGKTEQGRLAAEEARAMHDEGGSYYGALVAVAVVAALAIGVILVLLLLLLRRQGQASPTTTQTSSQAAYDNPSYKTYDSEVNGTTKNGDP